MNREKTAIIIGAGPAGLTAAYYLLKNTNVKPIVLEASKFIGGICRTEIHNGNRIDIGGHRFYSKSKRVNDFWNEMLPLQGLPAKDDILLERKKQYAEGGPDPEKADRVMLIRDRISRILYLHKFFDYPISLKSQTFINMGLKRTVKTGVGYIYASIKKRKENSLEDFYINRFGKPLYELFFEDYTEKVWGIHPSKINSSWGAQRVQGLSLWKAVVSVLKRPFIKNNDKVERTIIDRFIYPKLGPGELWEYVAEQVGIMGGEVYTDCNVCAINKEGDKIASVTAEMPDGKTQVYKADYYLSSMPIKDLINSMKWDVPKSVHSIANNLPYRDFITVGLLVNRMKIQNETKIKTVSNIVPDCWMYIQEKEVRIGRIQIFNNWSPYLVEDYENKIWIGLEYFCNEGDWMWEADDKTFIDYAVSEMEKINLIDSKDVIDSIRIKQKKAYPAYFGAYEHFHEVREYLNRFENLYCIGRNGQHRYDGMDHPILTGMEAADLIANNITDKSSLWIIDADNDRPRN